MKLVIKNGRVMDPASGRDEVTNIWVEDEKIIGFGEHPEWAEEAEELNAEGCVVAPGLVDVHVHFRDPGFTYKEDLETGSRAASAGGFTTVVCMANTKPGFIKKAMEAAARVDMPISLHEEDPTLNEVNGVNKGVISDKMGIGGAPAISEDVMVARDVMLALETGAKVDIQHISSGRSVDLVRLAKKKGAKVYAEATPHHFTLTEEDVPNYGTMAKMNPPLRTEWDRTKIIEGLADGTIDMIATDHAPHAIEEKEREFTKAPSGIVGLETSLSLGITSLVKRGYLTMMQLLEKMTVNPARLYKFDCGTLEEGKAADIVIFAPDEVRTVESFESKAENSPFLGAQLYGKVKYTICDGKVVYRG